MYPDAIPQLQPMPQSLSRIRNACHSSIRAEPIPHPLAFGSGFPGRKLAGTGGMTYSGSHPAPDFCERGKGLSIKLKTGFFQGDGLPLSVRHSRVFLAGIQGFEGVDTRQQTRAW
jgi:hypothetical protein